MAETKHNFDIEFLRQLDRYNMAIRKRVSTVYAGNRPSTRIGKGIDTVGYREYYQGDDMKDIDWKAYSRTEKLYIRQFEEEKTLTAHILLDASKSMDFPDNTTKKYEYAAMMALGVAYTVSRKNDKFAISTFNETIDINAPKRGMRYLLELTDRLASHELEGTTDLDICTHKYEKLIKSRSLVVIISDFMEDLKHIESSVHRLSGNDLILIQILDPFEKNLPIKGDSRFYDMETGDEMKTYLSDSFRNNYLKELDNHIAAIDHICKKNGAKFYSFTTEAPVFDSFLQIIDRGA
ncbi:hypothetical protein MmiHf6_06100 [Methanimicrococcus hongohii]|uniref:DUF58 domain-containing protein n=1 Tax=Methanimicrococcus hongohii TaxID=3028295 RepID=A0AA96UZP4_9EURY|nr:DUF58 domain-containing protein [Methanimicrococcus sp. Hf6]WNY23305.1 hypothetical protein MmiHf6_06100 [Methanimicrococcus sp. Hf6]